jgi:histidine ammonia-lyase
LGIRYAPAMTGLKTVVVGDHLTLEGLEAVALGEAKVSLGRRGRDALERAHEVVRAGLADGGKAIYGINTGFGALAEVPIDGQDLRTLQRNLIVSHAVGVGASLSQEVVRGMMLLRANVLSLGYSGARPLVVETLIEMINAGVHPRIPSKGSVGACGDLAPLAHLALVLIGEGKAEYQGDIVPGAEAMSRAGLKPVVLEAKEGLALINGTQGMLAIGGLALCRGKRLLENADLTGAMSLEALKGSVGPFHEMVVEARPHPGALASAKHLRSLLANSQIVESHADCKEVQDAYSLRCMPQVHGSARDILTFVEGVLSIELNSATDNPLILPDGRLQSGGNFHGQPVASALDAACIAMTDLSSISERRIAQMVDPTLSRGLPAFLALDSGLNSGLMMAQVTAAALVSESKALSMPKSVDTIPTSADREDHVSMGMTAARAFETIVEHAEYVLSIEAFAAAQGIWLRHITPGNGVERAMTLLMSTVEPLTEDRVMTGDMEKIHGLIVGGSLLAAAHGKS